jgi:hypothetical protein
LFLCSFIPLFLYAQLDSKTARVAVAQMDPDTEEVLAIHGSMGLAAAYVGGHGSGSQISRCCNGKVESAHGYKWRRADLAESKGAKQSENERLESRLEMGSSETVKSSAAKPSTAKPLLSPHAQAVPTAQLNYDTEELIFVHASMALAATHVGAKYASSITACCRGVQKSSHGYKWRRATTAEVDAAAVKFVSKQGWTLPTASQRGKAAAAKASSKQRGTVHLGQSVSSSSYKCYHASAKLGIATAKKPNASEEEGKNQPAKKKAKRNGQFQGCSVAQLDLHSGKVLCIHGSQQAAAAVVGVHKSAVSRSSTGKTRHSGGFGWRPATLEESSTFLRATSKEAPIPPSHVQFKEVPVEQLHRETEEALFLHGSMEPAELESRFQAGFAGAIERP